MVFTTTRLWVLAPSGTVTLISVADAVVIKPFTVPKKTTFSAAVAPKPVPVIVITSLSFPETGVKDVTVIGTATGARMVICLVEVHPAREV